jgi:hypothetical protein
MIISQSPRRSSIAWRCLVEQPRRWHALGYYCTVCILYEVLSPAAFETDANTVHTTIYRIERYVLLNPVCGLSVMCHAMCAPDFKLFLITTTRTTEVHYCTVVFIELSA